MFDSYAVEEFSSSSMQKATLSVVNVTVPRSPRNYSKYTDKLVLDKESEFGLSQFPVLSSGFVLFC